MQSIDINGKTTYKLIDLGVARQINPDEQTSDSISGTEEYVHPIVYRLVLSSLPISNLFLSFSEVFPQIKVNVAGNAVTTRMRFPFEVEMWSFGVTLYQCSTGLYKYIYVMAEVRIQPNSEILQTELEF